MCHIVNLPHSALVVVPSDERIRLAASCVHDQYEVREEFVEFLEPGGSRDPISISSLAETLLVSIREAE